MIAAQSERLEDSASKPVQDRRPVQVGRQAVRAAASAWGQHISAIAAGLVLTPLLIRELGASRYGAWGVCLAVFGYVGLLDLGVGAATSVEGARLLGRGATEACGSLIAATHSFFRRLALAPIAVGGSLAWWATRVSPAATAPGELAQIILIVGAAAALNILSSSYASTAAMLGRPHVASLGRMLGTWVYAVGGTYALLAHAGLRGVALAWASGNALSSLYIVANTYAVPVTLGHDANSRPRAARLVRMGLPYLTNSLAWQLVFATDSIVIASTLGTESVALYLPTFRLAEAIGYAALLPLAGLLPLMGAVFGAGDRSRLTTVLRRSTCVSVALAVVGGSLGAFFGASAIRLWVGADYFAGPLVLGALLTFVMVRSVTSTSGTALASAGHMQRVAIITLLEGAVNLLLSLLLIRPLGISGVALATLLAEVAVSAWVLPTAASRANRIDLREWLVPATARGIVAAAPAIAAALLIRIAWGEAVDARTLVGQVCACGVAGALGLWMFALEPSERRTVWRAFSLKAAA